MNDKLTWEMRTGQAIQPTQATRAAVPRGTPMPSTRVEVTNLSAVSDLDLYHELERREARLLSSLAEVSDQALHSELGRRRQAKRRVRRGGRPPKPRCTCGRFTQEAARKRGHVCGAGRDCGG